MKLFSTLTTACLLPVLGSVSAWQSQPTEINASTVFPDANGQVDTYQSTAWVNLQSPSSTDSQRVSKPTVTTTLTVTSTCAVTPTIGLVVTAAPNTTNETSSAQNNNYTLSYMHTANIYRKHQMVNLDNPGGKSKREDLNIKPIGSALNWKALLIVVSISGILLWLGTIWYFIWRIGKLNAAHEAEKAAAPAVPATPLRPYFMA